MKDERYEKVAQSILDNPDDWRIEGHVAVFRRNCNLVVGFTEEMANIVGYTPDDIPDDTSLYRAIWKVKSDNAAKEAKDLEIRVRKIIDEAL